MVGESTKHRRERQYRQVARVLSRLPGLLNRSGLHWVYKMLADHHGSTVPEHLLRLLEQINEGEVEWGDIDPQVARQLKAAMAVAAAGGTVTLAAVAAAAALLSFYCTHPFRRAAARAAPEKPVISRDSSRS